MKRQINQFGAGTIVQEQVAVASAGMPGADDVPFALTGGRLDVRR